MLKTIYNFLTGSKPVESNRFWVFYRGHASIYKKEKLENDYEISLQNCTITFDEKDPDDKCTFDYFLILANPNNKDQRYSFPISNKMKPFYEINENEKKIDFELRIEKDLYIRLEFIIKDDNYEESGEFRQILSRLLFQHKFHLSSLDCKNEEFLEQIPQKKEDIYSDKIKSLVKEFADDPKYLFAAVGSFFKIEDNKEENVPPETILKEAVFTILDEGTYKFKIIIFDIEKGEAHSLKLSSELSYYTCETTNNITWIDLVEDDIICLNFVFYRRIVSELSNMLHSCIIENTNKKSINDIIQKEKKNWEEYYIGKEEPIKEDDHKVINEFGQEKNEDFDYEYDEDFNDGNPEFENPIINFAQAKTKNRYFTNRGDQINVYKINDEHCGFDFLHNLPIVKSLENEQLIPKKIELQQDDSKMIFLDKKIKDRIFYYDLIKGCVIKEFKTSNNKKENLKKELRGLTLHGGKGGVFEDDSLFMAIDDNNIYKFDPRLEKYRVKSKSYKSEMQFNSILSTKGENFAVGSKNGNLRMYGKLGETARNLLPSFQGDKIISMDSTKDGKFILLTFKNYLIMFPTFQNSKSAFDYTFRVDDKPKPKILKISPKLLGRLGIKKVNFTSSRFNQRKNKKESYIIATTSKNLFFWNLNKVFKGHLISTKVHSVDGEIVQGEFLYNEENLVTALTHDLIFQKANLKNQ